MRPRHPIAAAYLGAAAVLLLLLWVGMDMAAAIGETIVPVGAPAGTVAADGDPDLRVATFAPPAPDEIREPLFDFALRMIAADSLGVWSAEQVRAYVDSLGRDTRLPLERLVSLRREPVPDGAFPQVRGRTANRRWVMTMTADGDFPMPYDILGYHPGSLDVSGELVFSEWRLGDMILRVPGSSGNAASRVRDVTVLKIESGYLVLDVDGWVDQLLGKALDDTWTTGFAVGRGGDGWIGLGLGRGRTGRRLYGAFDFAEDKVRPRGSPQEKGLSRACRPFTRSPVDSPNRPWHRDR